MTKNATYCDKHVSSRNYIFFVVKPREADDAQPSGGSGHFRFAPEEWRFLCKRPSHEVWVTQVMMTKAKLALVGTE